MALYEQHTWVSIADTLAKLATFAAANGWSVGTATATETAMTKGGVTLRAVQQDWQRIVAYAVVDGVQSGGVVFSFPYVAGKTTYFRLVACGNNIFIGRNAWYNTDTYHGWRWFGMLTIASKIGAWSGGTLLCSGTNNNASTAYAADQYFLDNDMYRYSTLYKEGVWTVQGNQVGNLWGSIGSEVLVQSPNYYNAATVPIPIMLFIFDTKTTYIHPIGYAPDVYRAGKGDIYVSGEIITINGSDYLWMPEDNNLLFKIY